MALVEGDLLETRAVLVDDVQVKGEFVAVFVDRVCRVDANMMRPSGRYFGMMSCPFSAVSGEPMTRRSSSVSKIYSQMFHVG